MQNSFKWLNKNEIKILRENILLVDTQSIKIQIGWYNVIKNMVEDIVIFCRNNKIDLPKVNQIKTKFGSIRFYYNSNNKELKNFINKWELVVNKTCEHCGSTQNSKIIIRENIVINLCENCRTSKDVNYNDVFNLNIN